MAALRYSTHILFQLFVCMLSFTQIICAQEITKRNTISLDGIWEIAEGKMNTVPGKFEHKIQVPGLVNLAVTSFRDAGPKVKDRTSFDQFDSLREAFWYKRIFDIKGPVAATAILKVSKAQYGRKIFINGKPVGENQASFTPGYYNVKEFLQTGTNEIMIRIGASTDAVPAV